MTSRSPFVVIEQAAEPRTPTDPALMSTRRDPFNQREHQTSSLQLAAQEAVFLDQTAQNLPLLAIQSADEDGKQQAESGGVDHNRSLYQRPGVRGRLGRAMGHYELDEVVETGP